MQERCSRCREAISRQIFREDALRDVPDPVLERARELYSKVRGRPNKVGEADQLHGWWVETFTLGCQDAGGVVCEGDKWDEHWEKYDEYSGDPEASTGDDPADGHFVVVYPYR